MKRKGLGVGKSGKLWCRGANLGAYLMGVTPLSRAFHTSSHHIHIEIIIKIVGSHRNRYTFAESIQPSCLQMSSPDSGRQTTSRGESSL